MANENEYDVQFRFDDYSGRFYRKDKNGQWYKFHQIGNAGVASDVAGLLIKLGHRVDFIPERARDTDW